MLDILLLPDLRQQEQNGGILLRPGGSAANTAAWIARLGEPVTFVGCVGNDAVGTLLQNELKEHGVTVAARPIPETDTGCVIVEIEAGGERLMRSARGANQHLSPQDLLRVASAEVAFVHLTGYALLGPMGAEMLIAAGQVARDRNARLSFDPSSVGVIEKIGSETLLEAIRMAGVDVLLPNEPEALALSGSSSVDASMSTLCGYTREVAMKRGALGATCCTETVQTHIPAETVRPIDTTGAGDAFDAGVLVSLVKGESLQRACNRGVALASQAICAYGGRPPGPNS